MSQLFLVNNSLNGVELGLGLGLRLSDRERRRRAAAFLVGDTFTSTPLPTTALLYRHRLGEYGRRCYRHPLHLFIFCTSN